MFKFVATAALAAVAVSGMPTVSEAGHARDRAHDCRICKTVSKMRTRMVVARERAPIVRRPIVWPKLVRAPREPLFKLLPRQPRPAVRLFKRERAPIVRRPIVWPKLVRTPREPLFKLLPRQPRPAVTHVRSSRVSLFTRRHRGSGTK